MLLLAAPAFAAHWIEEPVGPLERFIRDHEVAHRIPSSRLGVATAGPARLEVERVGGGDFWSYRVVVARGAQRIAVDVSQVEHLHVRPGRLLCVAEGAGGEQVVVTLTVQDGRIVSATARHDGPRRLFRARECTELAVRF